MMSLIRMLPDVVYMKLFQLKAARLDAAIDEGNLASVGRQLKWIVSQRDAARAADAAAHPTGVIPFGVSPDAVRANRIDLYLADALGRAIRREQAPIAEALLNAGADPNRKHLFVVDDHNKYRMQATVLAIHAPWCVLLGRPLVCDTPAINAKNWPGMAAFTPRQQAVAALVISRAQKQKGVGVEDLMTDPDWALSSTIAQDIAQWHRATMATDQAAVLHAHVGVGAAPSARRKM